MVSIPGMCYTGMGATVTAFAEALIEPSNIGLEHAFFTWLDVGTGGVLRPMGTLYFGNDGESFGGALL